MAQRATQSASSSEYVRTRAVLSGNRNGLRTKLTGHAFPYRGPLLSTQSDRTKRPAVSGGQPHYYHHEHRDGQVATATQLGRERASFRRHQRPRLTKTARRPLARRDRPRQFSGGRSMPAWEHSKEWGWQHKTYDMYRLYVKDKAPGLIGDEHDCADLSITLMVEFAYRKKLCVSFKDNVTGLYISKASGLITGFPGRHELSDSITWNSRDEFLHVVQKRTSAKDLVLNNTRVNDAGPTAGDLMLRYQNGEGHAALVFYSYDVGVPPGPEAQDSKTYPSFPGGDAAMAAHDQTRYFRGDVDKNDVTLSRDLRPPFDKDVHFNYLNSRGNKKRNAELIYFANARQLKEQGFDFYEYDLFVTDNWRDWDGEGLPPFSTHQFPDHR